MEHRAVTERAGRARRARRGDAAIARERGITRREIVVLIAVTLVLVGTVLPWWVNAQRQKGHAAGLARLQQWGIALNLYLLDNQNTYPRVGDPPSDPPDAAAWFEALPPYLLMPGFSAAKGAKDALWLDPLDKASGSRTAHFSFAMNRFLQPLPDQPPLRSYHLAEPGSTAFLVETSGPRPSAGPGDVVFRRGGKPPSPKAKTAVLFCDGHAELVGADRIAPPSTRDDAPLEPGLWVPYRGALAPVE